MKRTVLSVESLAACMLLLTVGVCFTATAKEPVETNYSPKAFVADEKGDEKGEEVIKIPIELVLLDVAVMDKEHRAVRGIRKNQFQIVEDKVPQQIEYFSSENIPISVGFIIDVSGSMRKKLPSVLESARAMVRMARPGDEFFVVQFREHAQLVEEFTSNLNEISEALDGLVANEGTSLLDAIYVSADYASNEAKNRRKALVVFSDGDERNSFFGSEQLLDFIRERDVQVFMVGFPDDPDDSTGSHSKALRSKAVKLMDGLSEESGGRAFFPTCLLDVKMITEQIDSDLHSQYTIGYFSNNEKRDGKWRRVQIKLTDTKKLSVRTRNGYFAVPTTAKAK